VRRSGNLRSLFLQSGDLNGLEELNAESIAIFCWSDERPLAGVAGFLDWRLSGALSRALIGEQFVGHLNESMLMPIRSRLKARRIFVFGLGKSSDFSTDLIKLVCCRALAVLEGAGVEKICLAVPSQHGQPEKSHQFIDVLGKEFDARVDSVLVDPATVPRNE